MTNFNETMIRNMIRKTGCTQVDAIAYLEAEEWNIKEAIISYRGDRT